MARSRSPPPIDRGWAWMISLGFFLYAFFMVGVAKSFGLILTALIKEFEVSTAYAAMPVTLCLLIYAFGAPTAIIVAEHFTIQKVVIFGAVFGMVGISLSSLLVSMLYFTIIFGISYGVGNSCFYGNGMIMLGKYFKQHRSFANGLALSGASIGQFTLPPIIEYLLENYGLGGTMLIIGAMYFHGAITGFLFRPIRNYASIESAVVDPVNSEIKTPLVSGQNGDMVDEKGNEHGNGINNGLGKDMMSIKLHDDVEEIFNIKLKEKDDEVTNEENLINHDEEEGYSDQKYMLKARMASTGSIFFKEDSIQDLTSDKGVDNRGAVDTKKEKKSLLETILGVLDFRVLKNYITLFYTTVSFLCFFGYFNFVLFLPAVVLEKGFTKYDKAWLVSICGIGDLIARLFIGFIADRNFIARYRIMALACLLCSLDIFMFILADSFAWLAVHSFLYGFFGGSYVCLVAVVLVDFVGLGRMGKNLAVVLFIQGIGSSAGQPFLGYLKDRTGSFNVVTGVCAFILALGAILLFCYPLVEKLEQKRQRRSQESQR